MFVYLDMYLYIYALMCVYLFNYIIRKINMCVCLLNKRNTFIIIRKKNSFVSSS